MFPSIPSTNCPQYGQNYDHNFTMDPADELGLAGHILQPLSVDFTLSNPSTVSNLDSILARQRNQYSGNEISPEYFINDQQTIDSTLGRNMEEGNSQKMENSTINITSNVKMICLVCGDKAVGYNFGVVSCESCKAFFRRNALKEKELPCPSDGRCKLTVASRRFCQRCRLRKCFEVGMKSEYIMTAEQLAQKRSRNRVRPVGKVSKRGNARKAKKDVADESDSGDNVNYGQGRAEDREDITYEPSEGNVDDANQFDQIGLQVALEDQTSEIRISQETFASLSAMDQPGIPEGEDELVDITIRVPKSSLVSLLVNQAGHRATGKVLVGSGGRCGKSDQVENEGSQQEQALAVQTDKSHPSTSMEQWRDWPVMPGNNVSGMNQQEIQAHGEIDPIDALAMSMDMDCQLPVLSPRSLYLTLKLAILDELVQATMEWKATNQGRFMLPVWNVSDFTKADWANLVYIKTVATTNQLSRLSPLKKFGMHDRYILFKYLIREVSSIRAHVGYDPQTEFISLPYVQDGAYCDLRLMKRVNKNIYESHKALFTSFPAKWRSDQRLILIMVAVALFNPNRPNLIDVVGVQRERDVYLELLRDYLEYTYGEQEVEWAYEFVVNRINYLSEGMNNPNSRVATVEIDPQSFDVTYCEVYDFE